MIRLINMRGRINLHTHTCYCDGENTPEELVQEAIRQNMTVLGFSGHSYVSFDPEGCMNRDKELQYRENVLKLKGKYKDKIRILLGIERDYFDTPFDDFSYDFVIGSVHYVQKDGEYICIDLTREEIKKGAEQHFGGSMKALVECYFDTVSDVINRTRCNIIGHLDLVAKQNEGNALFDENSVWYKKAESKAIAKLAAAHPIFEINTGGMAKGYRSRPYPSLRAAEEISRLGCQLILSSDCHDKRKLRYGFDELLKEGDFYPADEGL